MPYIAVKGTHDVLGKEAQAYRYITDVFKAVCELYGYGPIETPILEYTEVFDRATGESSDVVRKEMYTFKDKGDRSVTLRPEGTAGVMRSIVTNKLYVNDLPLKLYYAGPSFRYERPQQGRYRQFCQLGVEAVGVNDPHLDAEAICLAMTVLKMLGFENLKVKLNSLGDASSRAAYKDALRAYFAPRVESMCEDCKQRLLLNPMRILDCKVEADQEIAKGAPKMKDFLFEESEQRLYKTISLLNEMGVEYELDDTLVRGLDYYAEVVFEVHAISKEGKDYGALLGGGHYEGLLETFGGPKDIDYGVGFGMGLERIYSLMADNKMLGDVKSGVDIFAMPVGAEVVDDAFSLVEQIRALGYSVEMPFVPSKLGSMFKKAERSGAKFALIIGPEELARGMVNLKNLDSKEQKEVAIETLDETLDAEFEKLENPEHEHGEGCTCGHCHD